jgi:hypothetical protein
MKVARWLSLIFPSFCLCCQKKCDNNHKFLLCGDCIENIVFSFIDEVIDTMDDANCYSCFEASFALNKVCSLVACGKYPYFIKILASFMLIKLTYLPCPISYKIVPLYGDNDDKKIRYLIKNLAYELRLLIKQVETKNKKRRILFVSCYGDDMKVVEGVGLSVINRRKSI